MEPKMIETKTYDDGTTATGPAPLPLQSPTAQAVAGWKLVPVEPTQEMIDAWATACCPPLRGLSDEEVNKAWATADWSAMLAAAPTPEATQPTQAEAPSTIRPWEERVKPMYPGADPASWVPGVHLGGVESAMKAEIAELRAALATHTEQAAERDDACAVLRELVEAYADHRDAQGAWGNGNRDRVLKAESRLIKALSEARVALARGEKP
jgi:hypothetical protein